MRAIMEEAAAQCRARPRRADAARDAPPAAGLTATQAQAAKAIANIFETGAVRGDYGQVTLLPADTGRLTYGRAQATLGSGNLHLLIQRYCATVGARFGARLRAWLPVLASRSAAADTDGKLHNLLRACADDRSCATCRTPSSTRRTGNPPRARRRRRASARPWAWRWCTTAGAGSWGLMRDRSSSAGALAQVGEHEWIQRYLRNRREWLVTRPNALLRRQVVAMYGSNG